MTPEQKQAQLRAAGECFIGTDFDVRAEASTQLFAYVERLIAAETECCAVICERATMSTSDTAQSPQRQCAAAIRARANGGERG